MSVPEIKIILGHIMNPLTDKKCEWIKNGALVLKKVKGSTEYRVLEKGPVEKIMNKYVHKYPSSTSAIEVINESDKVIMPAFIDMHFHWVQDDVRLMPKASLLEWLSKYTWPYEAKFKSLHYAENKVKKFKEELLSVGTLGGACYASIHPHTVDLALKHFVGDYVVGNVLMTMNSPTYLSQTEKNALSTVQKLSKKYKTRYALTPRFAPTTSPKVMKEGSAIAKKEKSFIQTHLSETKNEIEYVLDLYKKIPGFEKIKNYTEIYHKTGILSAKTIMGHGIYLKDDELRLLARTKTAIAHCPTSNAPVKDLGLGSGLFDFKKIEKHKIPWALATDIGGGPYLSMLDVLQSFVTQNKKVKRKEATYTKALYRATLAGAKILGIHKHSGNLEKNKWANFIVLDFANKKSLSSGVENYFNSLFLIQNKRAEYSGLIKATFFKGNVVYLKKNNKHLSFT